MKLIIRFGTTLIVLAIFIFLYSYWRTRDYYNQFIFDWSVSNPPLYSKHQIDSMLQAFPQVSYRNLASDYKSESQSNLPKFKNRLASKTYYQISLKDFYKRIVGNVRIKHLLARDSYFRAALFDSKIICYWLIDERLLYKLLELKLALKKANFDPEGFDVRSGHRHPKLNTAVGGASSSRHIFGEAADLIIRDINQDGRYSKADKAIVLKLVDQHIIGNAGGVGRYPGSRSIHIDVRGRRARWDTY